MAGELARWQIPIGFMVLRSRFNERERGEERWSEAGSSACVQAIVKLLQKTISSNYVICYPADLV